MKVKGLLHLNLAVAPTALVPYDCLCVSDVMSCYPVSELDMDIKLIGDKGAKFLVKHYPDKNATGQLLEVLNLQQNDFTIDGLVHIMKIVKVSKFYDTLSDHCVC